jgi:hypothetical protein
MCSAASKKIAAIKLWSDPNRRQLRVSDVCAAVKMSQKDLLERATFFLTLRLLVSSDRHLSKGTFATQQKRQGHRFLVLVQSLVLTIKAESSLFYMVCHIAFIDNE